MRRYRIVTWKTVQVLDCYLKDCAGTGLFAGGDGDGDGEEEAS